MSRSNAEGDSLGPGLVIFETFNQHSKGEDLRFGHGVICRVAVRKNAGQLRHFRKPPAVVFALAFDLKVHGSAYFTPLLTKCLTPELSERPRYRLPHAEPANYLLATRVLPTIVHGPLQRVVRHLVPTGLLA